MLRRIGEFMPSGNQLQSPGGLSFDPKYITAIESHGGRANGFIRLYFVGGQEPVTLKFYNRVDGGPPDIYEITRKIKDANFAAKDLI